MPVTVLHLTAESPIPKKDEHVWAGNLLDIATARDLVALTRRRPWQGDSTVIHITASHRVRDDVWNTLLKVLEEPPPYVQFHLYAPSTDSIPRTIRSRSQVIRESLPGYVPEDASRLVRLIEGGDAGAILREGDRHAEADGARAAAESLWVYAVETGKVAIAFAAEHYLAALRQGANPRVTIKAMLLTLAIQYRRR